MTAMTTTPPELLRLLGAPVGPPGAGGAPAAAPASAADVPFAELLGRAQRGSLSSGIAVSVDASCPVTLTPEQLERLSIAADRAEAAGIHTAAAIIDGMTLRLDVHSRRITGLIDPAAGPVAGIDGIVAAPAPVGADAGTALAGPPRAGLAGNASVSTLLAALASPAHDPTDRRAA